MINCKKDYFNESSYTLLKVHLSEASFEKIKQEDFNDRNSRKNKKYILYVCGLPLNCEQPDPEYWNSWKGGNNQSLCRAVVANTHKIYCKNCDKIHKSKSKEQNPRKEWEIFTTQGNSLARKCFSICICVVGVERSIEFFNFQDHTGEIKRVFWHTDNSYLHKMDLGCHSYVA